jgi:adenylate kinase
VVRKLAEEAIADEGYDDFTLDGYPRTTQQAEWLTEFLRDHDAPLDAVVSLHVPDETIVDRLSKRRVHKETGDTFHLDLDPPPDDVDPDLIVQRPDDQPETIRNRLSVYHEQTAPLKAYYRQRGVYHEVDGVGDIEAIHERIVTTLDQAAAARA